MRVHLLTPPGKITVRLDYVTYCFTVPHRTPGASSGNQLLAKQCKHFVCLVRLIIMTLYRHAHTVRHVVTCTEYIIWLYFALGTRRSGGVRISYSHKDSPAVFMLRFVPCAADAGKLDPSNLAFQTKLN